MVAEAFLTVYHGLVSGTAVVINPRHKQITEISDEVSSSNVILSMPSFHFNVMLYCRLLYGSQSAVCCC